MALYQRITEQLLTHGVTGDYLYGYNPDDQWDNPYDKRKIAASLSIVLKEMELLILKEAALREFLKEQAKKDVLLTEAYEKATAQRDVRQDTLQLRLKNISREDEVLQVALQNQQNIVNDLIQNYTNVFRQVAQHGQTLHSDLQNAYAAVTQDAVLQAVQQLQDQNVVMHTAGQQIRIAANNPHVQRAVNGLALLLAPAAPGQLSPLALGMREMRPRAPDVARARERYLESRARHEAMSRAELETHDRAILAPAIPQAPQLTPMSRPIQPKRQVKIIIDKNVDTNALQSNLFEELAQRAFLYQDALKRNQMEAQQAKAANPNATPRQDALLTANIQAALLRKTKPIGSVMDNAITAATSFGRTLATLAGQIEHETNAAQALAQKAARTLSRLDQEAHQVEQGFKGLLAMVPTPQLGGARKKDEEELQQSHQR